MQFCLLPVYRIITVALLMLGILPPWDRAVRQRERDHVAVVSCAAYNSSDAVNSEGQDTLASAVRLLR